jgi:hypothetical protein
MQFFDREGVDVIPSKASLTLHDDEICLFENTQMLHHGAPIQVLEALDQLSSCSSSLFEEIEYFASSRVAEGLEDQIVLVFPCQVTRLRRLLFESIFKPIVE